MSTTAPPQPAASAHLLWAHPVPKIPLFVALTTLVQLLPALHCFRLCHQYGTSTHHTSTLLPPISRLPPSVVALIETHLTAAYRRTVAESWDAAVNTQGMCARCRAPAPAGGTSCEEALRRRVCKCRVRFLKEIEAGVGGMIERGKKMWEWGEGVKVGAGAFLRRFCGLGALVEGGRLWLVLPARVEGEGAGPVAVGRGYVGLEEGVARRFRWAVEVLGMGGQAGAEAGGQRCLVHWGAKGEDEALGEKGVRLMFFPEGLLVE